MKSISGQHGPIILIVFLRVEMPSGVNTSEPIAGLLEQKLLPSLTPKMNILDSEVVESSLTGNKRQTLRTYSSENLKLKNFRRDNFKEEYNVTSPQDHPTVVYDEYIKEGMPMPSPYGDSQQSK